VAVNDSAIVMEFRRLRVAYNGFMESPDPSLDPHQHVAGQGQDDKGNGEQDQSQRDQ
jgi:hypothetical protein